MYQCYAREFQGTIGAKARYYSWMRTILRTFIHSNGKRRVLIVRSDNGSYGFDAEHWSDESPEMTWIPDRQYPFSVCDSEEIACREAIGRVEWLHEATST